MKCFTCICLLIITFAALKVDSKCNCRVPYQVIGCFKDVRYNRALSELLINERDRYSVRYNGYNVEWYNWDEYMPAFTCRCAEAAMKKGYKEFGLQFWGECWSGPSPVAEKMYNKHGGGSLCYGSGYKPCSKYADNCVGDVNHNFVYEIVPRDNCPVKIERLGCYSDKRNPRPLPQHILTDRVPNSGVFSGQTIDWANFKTYLTDLSCRCAQVAKRLGYNTFGIQYFGDCWSGPQGNVTYFNNGRSWICLNQCYEICRSFDPYCTGLGHTSFVYRITEDVCEIGYKSLGCYEENKSQRALNELILTDVNRKNPKFSGMISTDFDDWATYMQGLVCRCARKVVEKGYTTFAIGNGGECWSGSSAHETFTKYGASEECYFDETSPCTSETTCAGGRSTNFVYQLV